MGTPDFAVPSLKILIDNGYRIPAVVTAPDKPRGRGQELSPTPIKNVAVHYKLPLLQPDSLKDPLFVQSVQSMRPDLIVVVAFRILPREIFTIPKLGSFNLHASLLPKYRGAAPINWAIIKGERETGVTTFLLQEKVDTGNVVLQARMPIADDDDAGTLHDKLADVGAEIVLHTVRMMEQGKASPRPQENALASPAPKIFKEDCHIEWNHPALQVHNFIRGLSPHPAAFARHNGRILKVYKTRMLDVPSRTSPGSVVASPSTLHISTTDTMLDIIELQQEGRKRMGVEEFLRGYKIASDDTLE